MFSLSALSVTTDVANSAWPFATFVEAPSPLQAARRMTHINKNISFETRKRVRKVLNELDVRLQQSLHQPQLEIALTSPSTITAIFRDSMFHVTLPSPRSLLEATQSRLRLPNPEEPTAATAKGGRLVFATDQVYVDNRPLGGPGGISALFDATSDIVAVAGGRAYLLGSETGKPCQPQSVGIPLCLAYYRQPIVVGATAFGAQLVKLPGQAVSVPLGQPAVSAAEISPGLIVIATSESAIVYDIKHHHTVVERSFDGITAVTSNGSAICIVTPEATYVCDTLLEPQNFHLDESVLAVSQLPGGTHASMAGPSLLVWRSGQPMTVITGIPTEIDVFVAARVHTSIPEAFHIARHDPENRAVVLRAAGLQMANSSGGAGIVSTLKLLQQIKQGLSNVESRELEMLWLLVLLREDPFTAQEFLALFKDPWMTEHAARFFSSIGQPGFAAICAKRQKSTEDSGDGE